MQAKNVLLINQPGECFLLPEANNRDQLCKKHDTPDLVQLFVNTLKGFAAEMRK